MFIHIPLHPGKAIFPVKAQGSSPWLHRFLAGIGFFLCALTYVLFSTSQTPAHHPAPVLSLLSQANCQGSGDKPQKNVRPKLTKADILPALGTKFWGWDSNGKNIGYCKIAVTFDEKADPPCYRVVEEYHWKPMVRGPKGDRPEIHELEFDGQAPYSLRDMRFHLEPLGEKAREMEWKRGADWCELSVTEGTGTTVTCWDTLDYTLGDYLAIEFWTGKGLQLGDFLTYHKLDWKSFQVYQESARVSSSITTLNKGKKTSILTIAVSRDEKEWSDRYRIDAKEKRVVWDGPFFWASEEKATNMEWDQEIFQPCLVHVNKALGHPQEIIGLELEAYGKGASALKSFPGQWVKRNPSGSSTIKLGKANPNPAPQATPEEMAECLKETPEFLLYHPEVQVLAGKAIGKATTTRAKVNELVHFIHEYITYVQKCDNPSLLTILKERKGDCKSYALLFTTLARAAGIPARTVGGLAYRGEEGEEWCYHAWNEVVIDGRWFVVDAGWDETEADPTHIRLDNYDSGESLGFKLTHVTKRAPAQFAVPQVGDQTNEDMRSPAVGTLNPDLVLALFFLVLMVPFALVYVIGLVVERRKKRLSSELDETSSTLMVGPKPSEFEETEISSEPEWEAKEDCEMVTSLHD